MKHSPLADHTHKPLHCCHAAGFIAICMYVGLTQTLVYIEQFTGLALTPRGAAVNVFRGSKCPVPYRRLRSDTTCRQFLWLGNLCGPAACVPLWKQSLQGMDSTSLPPADCECVTRDSLPCIPYMCAAIAFCSWEEIRSNKSQPYVLFGPRQPKCEHCGKPGWGSMCVSPTCPWPEPQVKPS